MKYTWIPLVILLRHLNFHTWGTIPFLVNSYLNWGLYTFPYQRTDTMWQHIRQQAFSQSITLCVDSREQVVVDCTLIISIVTHISSIMIQICVSRKQNHNVDFKVQGTEGKGHKQRVQPFESSSRTSVDWWLRTMKATVKYRDVYKLTFITYLRYLPWTDKISTRTQEEWIWKWMYSQLKYAKLGNDDIIWRDWKSIIYAWWITTDDTNLSLWGKYHEIHKRYCHNFFMLSFWLIAWDVQFFAMTYR